uniref:Polymerase nucleotidyl transferase domain-containing protein n=1 Tax=candidate division WOR-3 bacterium TaxID=2052148 RepID=A0A7V3PT44_UNCW3
MKPDEYIRLVRAKYELLGGAESPAEKVAEELKPAIREWAGRYLVRIEPAGSYAKGTRIRGGTDIDILISLGAKTPLAAKKIYEHFFNWLKRRGFNSAGEYFHPA